MNLPRIRKVRQVISQTEIADLRPLCEQATVALASRGLRPHSKVAVCVGSRGIAQIVPIAAHVVDCLKRLGHEPFVLGAMGSHGGGTAAGQRALLESLGVTEAAIGAPIVTDDRTTVVGVTSGGLDVFVNPIARTVDGVLLINRVKPHTTLRPPLGSGLCKMLSIGLGNRDGATQLHGAGLADTIYPAVAVLRRELPLLGGIAIVDNGSGRAAHIEAVVPDDFEARDRELLVMARRLMPNIPVEPIDVLVVSRVGKDISGTGMDSNVIGIHRRLGGPPDRQISTIGVLDLTEASHGNATGIGMADFATEAMIRKVDWDVTRTNCLAGGFTHGYREPVVVANDRALFERALEAHPQKRLALIKDTKALEQLWLSESLVESAPDDVVPIDSPRPIPFDDNGRLRFEELL